MKALLRFMVVAFGIVAHAASAGAETIAEGKKLLDAAVAEVSAAGPDVAARNFIADGKWRVGSTYVVLNDFTAKVLAHSANPKMVGKVMLHARDASGKPFVEEAVKNIKAHGESAVELKWANPETKKFQHATMLSKRVPGKELYVSVLVFD